MEKNITGVAAIRRIAGPRPAVRRTSANAFTLTELLVVITIIAILASLITAGAMNAMRRGREAAITLEIGQLNDAIERFKTEMGGGYPPNVYWEGDLSGIELTTNLNNLKRFLTKARPRAVEFETAASAPAGTRNLQPLLDAGIRPSEALVLWLMGFSGDVTRPFSGTDLEVISIDDDDNTSTPDTQDVITFDSFDAPLFDFDKSRLRLSRDSGGALRYIEVYGAGGTGPAKLLLYEYYPKGSEKPYVYFNTVDSPEQVVRTWDTNEFSYTDPKDTAQVIYPLKQKKANAPTGSPTVQSVEYVNQGKFQILHPGLDDAWGDFTPARVDVSVTNGDTVPVLLYPEGPFTGDMADTLTNFTTGKLESEQE